MKTRYTVILGLFFVGIISLEPTVFGEHVIVEGEKRAMEGILKTERATMVSEMQAKSEKETLQKNETVDTIDFREAGETIQNSFVVIIIEGLGVVLIVFFIIFYAIKKRRAKQSIEKNEN